MKKIAFFVLVLISTAQIVQAKDTNSDLIELAKIYRSFMFSSNATEYAYEKLEKINSIELVKTVSFVKETITTNNNLTSENFLILPDQESLYQIYIIRRINWNLRAEKPKNNDELILELKKKNIPRYELIDSYYSMLFTGIGNKNNPFDLSEVDFRMDNYLLNDDTEKGIFFLKCMQFCGTTIWGYMNVVTPPNYKKALQYIDKFPLFNGQKYYEYLDFGFTDFEMEIESEKGIESYKHYYINKYYETLLYHLICLDQKKKHKKERQSLLLSSILKEKNYYKYSKNRDVLDNLFTSIKKD